MRQLASRLQREIPCCKARQWFRRRVWVQQHLRLPRRRKRSKSQLGRALTESAPDFTDREVLSRFVGESQFVQWVNTDIAVFDKNTGAVALGPIPGNTIWQGFGGNCEQNNDGDPIVQYDKIANRWVIAQFSVKNGFSQCVAVSTTADASGTYHRYEFQYEDFDDYPKMGIWPDGYYISFNMFHGQNFVGSKVCAYERAAMLAGLPARQQCFQLSDQFFGLLPADLDGATSALVSAEGTPGSAAPPLGSPNFFLALGSQANTLDLWNFHVDWNATANTTFGIGPNHTPNQSIPVAAFTFACGGSGGSCIPQPGNPKPEQLDTLGKAYVPQAAGTAIYVLMAAVLLWRPAGLFARA